MTPAYPCPGCICEYLEANTPQTAIVLEENGGKLRLLLPGRKELKLSANRLLPWLGPINNTGAGKEEMLRFLEQHKQARDKMAGETQVLDLWEMAQGEVSHASAHWFAELVNAEPDADMVAAYGRALLACKTHFRFQPPDFLVYDEETVQKRLLEQKAREEKEAIASKGSAFFRLLCDVAFRKRDLPPPDNDIFPQEELAQRIERLLMARMINPDSMEDDALWRLLSKGLPDAPHLPLQMLIAWGRLPRHYNFWLDRADYARDESWHAPYAEYVEALACSPIAGLPECELPFISIDGDSTFDIDDAFHIEKQDNCIALTLAFACPALNWPFDSPFDKAVSRRATSIYLPEGDLHMLPANLGTDVFSLLEGQERPALCLRIEVDEKGAAQKCEPFAARVKLAANLRYGAVQNIINGSGDTEDNPAYPYREQILLAHELAGIREKSRIADGAVIMIRKEPSIELVNNEKDVLVKLKPEQPIQDAQRLVSEMMILASACFADWAFERGIPLLHRVQNVALPKEYAGIWERPEDLARIMRALIPSSLELAPKPHAALGLERYAQATSPLRRYPDLVNEAQILSWLTEGKPRFDANGLAGILDSISPALDSAQAVQRYRPRYWKLLYLRQQGDKVWRQGVITEENENFVNVTLPEENLYVRGRRNLFDERATAGMSVRLRLGKINPLANEIQILETMPDD